MLLHRLALVAVTYRDLIAIELQTAIFRLHSLYSRSKILRGVGLRPSPRGVACERTWKFESPNRSVVAR